MEKRWKGKPFFDKRKEIKGGFDDYLEEIEMPVNGSAYNGNGSIDETVNNYVSEANFLTDEVIKTDTNEYNEVIKSSGLPPASYLVSQKAFEEVNKIKNKYALTDDDGSIDEAVFRLAIEEGKINFIGGVLQESYSFDSDVGDFVKTLDEVKYLISAKEVDKDIKLLAPFKEVTMDSALPGDTIYINDLDIATQNKINNLEYGGSSHKIFEPFDHEWENEHIRE